MESIDKMLRPFHPELREFHFYVPDEFFYLYI